MENNTTGLTNEEVVGQLRKLVKPYIGLMLQSSFSIMLKRIAKDKTCKPATVDEFFAKFGYTGTWNNYTKKEPQI